MEKDHRFIALAGNIGIGKTSIGKLIQREFGYELFEEPVIDNRFLKQYYAGTTKEEIFESMKRWAFTLQLEFLTKRAEHHDLIESIEQNCVQDRSLIEDPLIFASHLHTIGAMTDNEYTLYLEIFNDYNLKLRQPDRIILLSVDNVDILEHRIKTLRAREEEKNIPREFLDGLQSRYITFAQASYNRYKIPVSTINITHMDIRTPEGKDELKRELEQILRAA